MLQVAIKVLPCLTLERILGTRLWDNVRCWLALSSKSWSTAVFIMHAGWCEVRYLLPEQNIWGICGANLQVVWQNARKVIEYYSVIIPADGFTWLAQTCSSTDAPIWTYERPSQSTLRRDLLWQCLLLLSLGSRGLCTEEIDWASFSITAWKQMHVRSIRK